jgi:hypothetical protein
MQYSQQCHEYFPNLLHTAAHKYFFLCLTVQGSNQVILCDIQKKCAARKKDFVPIGEGKNSSINESVDTYCLVSKTAPS